MNRDGARASQAGLTYCKNKMHLDLFMSERLSAFTASDDVRARYKERVKKLGGRLNSHCTYTKTFAGPAFAPVEEIKVTYKGPDID